MAVPWYKKVYALYRGDEFISVGTLKEISQETKQSVTRLRSMTYPCYQKLLEKNQDRLALFLLEDD